jgi:hypothetical protein
MLKIFFYAFAEQYISIVNAVDHKTKSRGISQNILLKEYKGPAI